MPYPGVTLIYSSKHENFLLAFLKLDCLRLIVWWRLSGSQSKACLMVILTKMMAYYSFHFWDLTLEFFSLESDNYYLRPFEFFWRPLFRIRISSGQSKACKLKMLWRSRETRVAKCLVFSGKIFLQRSRFLLLLGSVFSREIFWLVLWDSKIFYLRFCKICFSRKLLVVLRPSTS